MTELVIRIDPARALATAYAHARDGALRGWRYVERTWRTLHDQPVVTRLILADRKTHLKLAMGAVAVASLLTIYGAARAITATPPRPALKQRLDDAAADTKASVRKVDLAKPQIASLEPKPVKTERILPSMPTPSVPAPEIEEDPTPALTPSPPLPPTRKRYAAAAVVAPVVRDICTRHGLHKQITRGGKSWRCRR